MGYLRKYLNRTLKPIEKKVFNYVICNLDFSMQVGSKGNYIYIAYLDIMSSIHHLGMELDEIRKYLQILNDIKCESEVNVKPINLIEEYFCYKDRNTIKVILNSEIIPNLLYI